MNIKTTFLIILVMFIAIGAVSAGEDISQDNLTQISCDIPEASAPEDDSSDDVLGQDVSDDNQSVCAQESDEVLGLIWDDITINGNTKTIDATKGNTVIATVKIPKGEDAYVEISGHDIPEYVKKLSKITHKKTANGFTTYTVYLKDLPDYSYICDNLVPKSEFYINVKFYNPHEKEQDCYGFKYLVNVNKKAKTFRLKKKIETQVWASNYDRKSGTNKKLTIHLGLSPSEKPIAGKKVKITINGVVYNKKTNSKGIIYIYPPKYLAPKEFQEVKMEYAGDDKYTACMTINHIQIYKNPGSSKSAIKANPKTFPANKTKKYTVKLLSKGKAIKKANLKFTIAGKKYSAKTNSKGQATFDLAKLNKKGKFTGTIVYMGDSKHYMTYKNVKLTFD